MEFKVGDRVYCSFFRLKGTVKAIDSKEFEGDYPICVQFDNQVVEYQYTNEGVRIIGEPDKGVLGHVLAESPLPEPVAPREDIFPYVDAPPERVRGCCPTSENLPHSDKCLHTRGEELVQSRKISEAQELVDMQRRLLANACNERNEARKKLSKVIVHLVSPEYILNCAEAYEKSSRTVTIIQGDLALLEEDLIELKVNKRLGENPQGGSNSSGGDGLDVVPF